MKKGDRAQKMKQTKKLLMEMFFGMGVWAAVMSLVLMLVALRLHIFPLAMVSGVLLGTLTSAGLLFHMYKHLDIALDMAPDKAGRYTQVAAVKRMFIMAAVMACSFLFMDYLHPAGTAFGILGMKASALMYPKLHIFAEKYDIFKKV